jgi:fumarylpyruvate hydrolase
MSSFVIPEPPVTSLPVEGSDRAFPVRRIYCIGRNYGAHVKEMGGDPKEQPPIFFMKPADAAVEASGAVPYPPGTENFHHEVELVVALKTGGADVAADKALDLVYGYAVGVDLTRRDLQNTAKDKGQPWDSAKGFDASGPIGLIRPADKCGALDGRITIAVNGQTKQDGKLSDMIWGVAEIIAAVSKLWTLQPGDLIFTGTPDGVGPLQKGDKVAGAIDGLPPIAFTVA